MQFPIIIAMSIRRLLGRPGYSWPDTARLAVYLGLNIERGLRKESMY